MTRPELLDKWAIAVGKMHIGHHLAASSCTTWHYILGVSAIFLTTALSATSFAAVAKFVEKEMPTLFVGLTFLSMLTPALTAAVTFLKLDERALRHTEAAASFGGLRRHIEEQLVLAEDEKAKDLGEIRDHWREVIKKSPPLPSRMYYRAERQLREERLR